MLFGLRRIKMPCNCDGIKEELALMREQVGLMRHHSNQNYVLLIEIRDRIMAESANIMQFLYPVAMEKAPKSLEEVVLAGMVIKNES